MVTRLQSSSNTDPSVSSPFEPISSKKHSRSVAPHAAGRTALGIGFLLLSSGVSPAQEADQAVDLPTIDVFGNASKAYNPGETQLSRVPTPLIDTPQTVNVVPQQVLKDQKTTTLVEALRNVPGITFNAGEGGTQGDNINIRGFTARNDIYRDGAREPGWYTRDTFSVDRVEVLKGPSSFLFGRGSTGGIVNIVSKLPTFTNFTEAEISASSAPGARSTIDFNRVINDNVAARVVLMGTNTDTAGRDITKTKRFGFAPSVTIKPNGQTSITLSYIYQKDDNIPDYGIPQLPRSYFGTPYDQTAPVSRKNWYGQLSPGLADTEKVDAHIATAKIEHEFNKDWKVTNTFRYSYVDRFTRVRGVQVRNTTNPATWNIVDANGALIPAGALPGTPLGNIYINNTNHFQNATKNELVTNQTDLVGKFTTGFLSHTAVVGVELSHEKRDNLRTNITGGDLVNVLNPNPYPADPGTLAATSASTKSSASTVAVYASDQIKITNWLDLLAGVRFDHYRAEQTGVTITRATGAQTAPVNLENSVNNVSYRAGAVVHPFANSSLYFVYGTSFNPPGEFTTITPGQQTLDPVKNETFEIGAKADFLEGRLSVNGAIFRTNKDNDIEQTTPGEYGLVGRTRVQGFEVGLTGKLTDKWNVFAGYTYLDGKVLASATAANIGHTTAQTPKNSFSLFSTYDVTDRWMVGGGAFYVDERWSSAANGLLVPSYWRFDAVSSYRVSDNFTVQLNLYNLANTTNFESIAGAGWAVPGPGRSGTLTARLKF